MTHELDVLAIADDVTGAMDVAAPFATRGARVVVCEPRPRGQYPAADVLVVDTGTRLASARAGAAVVRDVVAGAPSAAVRFKKIDSTLRGNIVAEVTAAATGTVGLLVAPAVPWQGRIVRGGRVLVRGSPLADTDLPFPLHDAESVDDLVALVRDAQPGTLLVGAAGLAEALAEVRHGPALPAAPLPVARAVLVVAGSRTPVTARQLERLQQATGADGCILTTPVEDGDPHQVAAVVAERAAARVAADGIDALVLVGGETARAALRALGHDTIHARGTIAGTPYGTAGGLTVVTKAGGFGDDETLVAVWTALLGA